MPIISNLYNLDALFPTYTSSDAGKMPAVNSSGTGYELVDAPERMPPGGTAGQVLSKTEDGTAWTDPPSGGVQPDWHQNDPTAADYVQNRTHYDEQIVIEWDGDTNGRVYVTIGVGVSLYKVSDFTPSIDEIVGSTISLSSGQMLNVAYSDLTVLENVVVISEAAVIAYTDNAQYETIVFQQPGVYFIHATTEVGTLYASGITYEHTKKLNRKYLPPDSILPYVTSDDAGNVLRVVNGNWVSTPVAEPVFFVTFTASNIENSGICRADKTYNQVLSAINEGHPVIGRLTDDGQNYLFLQLIRNKTTGDQVLGFSMLSSNTVYIVDFVTGTTARLFVYDIYRLPLVTTSDDGKLLQVVNGEWAAVDIGSAVQLLAETGVAEPVTDGSAILTDANGIIYVL